MDATTIGMAGAAPRVLPDRGLGTLKSEDFFRILVTELQHQDPLEPSKTSDMISNVSQIRSIELSGQLGNTLDTLVRQQRSAGMSDMLGKLVTARVRDAEGVESQVQGIVTGVRFAQNGTALLELDNGMTVPATDVMHVTTVDGVALTLASLLGEPGTAQAAPPAVTAAPAGELTAKATAMSRRSGPVSRFFGALGL